MSEATARTAVYNAINGVSSVGVVYDYERWSNDWGNFLDLFKTTVSSTDQIRGWMVGYRGAPAEDTHMNPGRFRTHRFSVHGFLGLDDSAATEKTMSALCEAVQNALDDDTTVHGFYHTTPASLETFETRVFGSVLCHYAEIQVEIMEYRA